MKLYYARHGQVLGVDKLPPETAALYPHGDIPLTPLGIEQARLLGMRLADMGFCGKILSSPYIRTLETASAIAEITGSEIIPVPCLREIFVKEESAKSFRGLTIEEIKDRFKYVSREATLPDNWWCESDGVARVETREKMFQRVKDGFLSVLKDFSGEKELLAVGHGASVAGLSNMYDIPKRDKSTYLHKDQFRFYNCSLSAVDLEDEASPVLYHDTDHIPYEKCTSNPRFRCEFDREFFDSPYEGEIQLPSGAEDIKGKRLLHISDTFSKAYPYYRKLIEAVKPDIILHTGDMADEVKVGRIQGKEYEYRVKVEKLLEILQKPGVPLVIVPGNNDLRDVISELAPNALICEENELVELDGQKCRVGHRVSSMTFDSEWNFYGHGPTGDDWALEQNVPGVNWRFNGYINSFLCSVSEKKYFMIPLPDDCR